MKDSVAAISLLSLLIASDERRPDWTAPGVFESEEDGWVDCRIE
jgi:hypothetical protein